MLGVAHDSLQLGMKTSLAPLAPVEQAAIFYMTKIGAHERCSWSWERHGHISAGLRKLIRLSAWMSRAVQISCGSPLTMCFNPA